MVVGKKEVYVKDLYKPKVPWWEQLIRKLWIFGYCGMCQRYFVYPKRRRMSTQYEKEKSNYCTTCLLCFEEVEKHWKERWDELNAERLSGLW